MNLKLPNEVVREQWDSCWESPEASWSSSSCASLAPHWSFGAEFANGFLSLLPHDGEEAPDERPCFEFLALWSPARVAG